MDILVPDGSSRHRVQDKAHPYDAWVWGVVAATVLLGFLLVIGTSGRGDRLQVASGEPVLMKQNQPLLTRDLPVGHF